MNKLRLAIIGIKGIPANYGGFETCVDQTSNLLIRKEMDVKVFCRKNLYKKEMSYYKGVDLTYVWNIKTKNLATITATFFSVLYIILSKVNIVHIYISGNSIFIPLLKIFGKKCVISVDGLDWKRKKWGFFASKYIEYSEYIAVKMADSIISDSRYICDYYKKKYNRTIDYVSFGTNTIDSEINLDISKYGLTNNKYFLFVGIFRPEKNVDLLIKAFNQAQTKNFKLALIGDDPLNKQYVNYIHSLKSDKVIFLGRIYGDKYEQLSSKAFCYISASEVEGTSPALLSAMGFKTPVLVSDIPENIETIKKYGTTFMTNDESDLIRKIEYVINNPLKVQNLSKKAFKMVKQLYSWEKVADDLHKIYKRL